MRPRQHIDRLENTLLGALGLTSLFFFACLLAAMWQLSFLQSELSDQARLGQALYIQHDRFLQLINEEAAVRGYVATCDVAYLDGYYRAARALHGVTLSAEMSRAQSYFKREVQSGLCGDTPMTRADLARGRAVFLHLRRANAVAELALRRRVETGRRRAALVMRTGFTVAAIMCGMLLIGTVSFSLLWLKARSYRIGALRDPLTGVANRRGAITAMRALISATRTESFGVVFFDLDSFKKINDLHGHAAGDAILQNVARRLQDEVRDLDTVCRLGGDEFLCVISRPANRGYVGAIAERLRAAVCKPYALEHDSYVVGCSAGISMYPDDGQSAEALLDHADRKMYAQKTARRDESSLF